MRTLVLIASDHYVRNFIETGAFDGFDPAQTYYVASESGVAHEQARERLRELPTYLGTVPDPRPRARKAYRWLRKTLLTETRGRSRTMAHKARMMPRHQRVLHSGLALPGVRRLTRAAAMARGGLNGELHELIARIDPDLVVAPSGGFDSLVWDGLRSARKLEVPTLLLIHNWDNLSSKGTFAVDPGYLAVWGPQSVEHAERIHGVGRDRVRAVGTPTFDHYFRYRPGSAEPPFPFRYALFAGCFAPFDELSALRRLEALIAEERLDIKVVYRPHPHRFPRQVPDFMDEEEFEHVVLDPQVKPFYEASFREFESWNTPQRKRLKPLLPALDYYPALFEHAEFVVCPLSTMLVEAAIFERRVAVVAYDDGIHENSPAAVVNYDHFEGIDRVDGFELCRRPEDLSETFRRMAAGELQPATPLREQIRWWLTWDERRYSERLAEWVAEIAERERIEPAPVLAHA
jgi:hypothetical protein